MSRQELNLGVGELLASQEGQHLVPEQVGVNQLTYSYGREEQEFEQNFMLHIPPVLYRAKKACQLVGRQQVRERACPLRLRETEVLPGLLAHITELVVTEALAASEAPVLSSFC